MSRVITQSIEGSITHAFGMVEEFLRVCPENIRDKKFGGWPVWQQILHAVSSVDFFLPPSAGSTEAPGFDPEVAQLKTTPATPMPKLALEDLLSKTQDKVKKYLATMDDAKLAQKHESLSSYFGRDVIQAEALGLIASHTMYHLGSCDAALREHGLPGVF